MWVSVKLRQSLRLRQSLNMLLLMNLLPPAPFASGRYTVSKFLGEGGKKKVYLAHDNTLDRDVAFALIKTEGLDEIS